MALCFIEHNPNVNGDVLTKLSYPLREAVNNSARETWDDEFVESKITKAPCKVVRPPRVADSPVSFECQVQSIFRIPNESRGDDMSGPHLVGTSDIVIGRVLGIHVKGEYINDAGVSYNPFFMKSESSITNTLLKIFDVLKAAPIARMGYHQYTHVSSAFDMKVPMMPDDLMSEGVLGGNFDVVQAGRPIKGKEEKAEKAG
jgi:flavin reductase (DIM6/NTAB) family NADH-FMN oxidoreductase RutF